METDEKADDLDACRDLLFAVVLQAYADYCGAWKGNPSPVWLLGKTCKEYCELLGVSHGKLRDRILAMPELRRLSAATRILALASFVAQGLIPIGAALGAMGEMKAGKLRIQVVPPSGKKRGVHKGRKRRDEEGFIGVPTASDGARIGRL